MRWLIRVGLNVPFTWLSRCPFSCSIALVPGVLFFFLYTFMCYMYIIACNAPNVHTSAIIKLILVNNLSRYMCARSTILPALCHFICVLIFVCQHILDVACWILSIVCEICWWHMLTTLTVTQVRKSGWPRERPSAPNKLAEEMHFQLFYEFTGRVHAFKHVLHGNHIYTNLCIMPPMRIVEAKKSDFPNHSMERITWTTLYRYQWERVRFGASRI